MFFGNPYTPMFVPEIPSMLLTYDFSDYAEDVGGEGAGRRDRDRRQAADRAAGLVSARARA